MADESDRDEPLSDQPASDQRSSDQPTEPEPTQPDPSRSDPSGSEPTQPLPSEPQPTPPAGDETAVAHPPDLGPSGTTVMPPVPPTPPVWSARAQVRPPEPEQPTGRWDQPASGADDWETDDSSQGRRWLAPVLITLLVLVLLAILAFGIWLVVSSQDNGTSTPTPTTPSATAQSSVASTPPRTTAAVTTPPVTTPVMVGVPDVRGLDFNTAAGELRALGFQVSRTTQNSTSVAAGKVIGTDPPNGSQVAPSSTVTVIVSAGSPTTAPPSPRTPTPTATPSTHS